MNLITHLQIYSPKCLIFPSNLKIPDRHFVPAQGFGAGKVQTMSSRLIDDKSSFSEKQNPPVIFLVRFMYFTSRLPSSSGPFIIGLCSFYTCLLCKYFHNDVIAYCNEIYQRFTFTIFINFHMLVIIVFIS